MKISKKSSADFPAKLLLEVQHHFQTGNPRLLDIILWYDMTQKRSLYRHDEIEKLDSPMEAYDPDFYEFVQDQPPILSQSENMDSQKTNFQDIERLRCLLAIAERVDVPSFAFSFEEISIVLTDLALTLQNSSEDRTLNDEVYEDPLERPDVLGNVMILHRKQFRYETDLLERLGRTIQRIVHIYRSKYKKHQIDTSTWENVQHKIDQYDDIRSEGILEAKELIVRLRNQLERKDQRNHRLFYQLKRARDLNKKLQEENDNLRKDNTDIVHLFEVLVDLLLADEGSKSTPVGCETKFQNHDNSCVEDDGPSLPQTRNLCKTKSSNSQLEHLWW